MKTMRAAREERAEVEKLQAVVDRDLIDLVTEGVLPLSIVDNCDLHEIMGSKSYFYLLFSWNL